MVGRVAPPQAGFDRDQAPPPFSGFDTARTPFDNGHIMALELGGPDVTQNIVPQCAAWQENGPWKRMEDEVKELGGPGDHVLVVSISYDHGGMPNYETSKQEFDNHLHRLTAWADTRIPTRFKVWARSHQNLNTLIDPPQDQPDISTKTEADALHLLDGINANYDFDVSVMPAEDRVLRRKEMIGYAAKAEYRAYEQQWGADQGAYLNIEVAVGQKRTRSMVAAQGPPPPPKQKRRDCLRENWQQVIPNIDTTNMTLAEQNFQQHEIVESVVGMFGV